MNKEIVLLIPIYNPDLDITTDFIKELKKKYENIVFINDGCDKIFDSFFKNISKDYPVIKHYTNLGKGRGIKNGINYILEHYPDSKVIVTADCDGQHAIKDIDKVAKCALKNLDSLVLGCRDFSSKSVPLRSMMGNNITRNVFATLLGQKITDTQTGLRSMSMNVALKLISVDGERYEYETKTLIEVKKLGIDIKEVTIDTIYINDNKASHYNPFKDSLIIYKKFTKYFLALLLSFFLQLYLFNKLIVSGVNIYLALLFAQTLFVALELLFTRYINKYLVLSTFILELIVFLVFARFCSCLLLLKIFIDVLVFIYFIFIKRLH